MFSASAAGEALAEMDQIATSGIRSPTLEPQAQPCLLRRKKASRQEILAKSIKKQASWYLKNSIEL